MDYPEGAGLQRSDRVDFDPRVRLEFRGTPLSTDSGLLVNGAYGMWPTPPSAQGLSSGRCVAV